MRSLYAIYQQLCLILTPTHPFIRHRKERNSSLSWQARDAAAERDSAQSEREEPSGSVEFFMSRVTNRNYNERGGREAKKAVCLRWEIRKYFHTFNGVCDIMCNETRFTYLHPLLTCDNKLLVSLFCNTLCSPDLMDNYRVVWRSPRTGVELIKRINQVVADSNNGHVYSQ